MNFFTELKKDIEETKSLLKSLIESQHQNIKVEDGEQVLNVDECNIDFATMYRVQYRHPKEWVFVCSECLQRVKKK